MFPARAALACCMARIDGVTTCEGTRVFGATVPSCGSGFVLARAGKALAAGGALSGAAQRATGGGAGGASGALACAAHAGHPAHTAAISSGLFISTSIDHSF